MTQHPRTSTDPLLSLEGLGVGYGRSALLPAFDVTVRPGEFWVVLGRNGSGKSTLLRTLLGLQAPVAGRVRRAEHARLGYAAQRATLESDIPMRAIDAVLDGVETGWSFAAPLGGARRAAARRALEQVGALHLATRTLASLSEGQRQRVLVARAMASEPQLLVLDEPSSAMDRIAENELHELLRSLVNRFGISVLLVNHHLDLALRHATHAVVVDRDEALVTAGDLRSVTRSGALERAFPGFRFAGLEDRE